MNPLHPESFVSRLMLGTVQFGMPYGIANTRGQPDYRRAVEICEVALEAGIRSFDTAAAYGSSEEVLGRALRELGALDDAFIVTKARHLQAEERANPVEAGRAIERSVQASRRRLGLDCIPLVMFHHQSDAVHAHALDNLRERGWLRQIGFSLVDPPVSPLSIDSRFTAVQVPGNLLDRWLRNPAIAASLSRPGLGVFIRSVYLQGLLVMPLESVPAHLADVLPIRRRLAAIALEGGMTEAEMALRYVLGLNVAKRVLVGVETPEQLRGNIRMARKGPLPPNILADIAAAVADVNERILAPSGWSALARAAVPDTPKNVVES